MSFFKNLFKKKQEYQINELDLGIGSQRIKIKPTYEDMQIAYKLWVELSTRKIGLEIDFRNDVIEEIYDSWYEFFRLTRELIKDIPIYKIRKSESTKKLVQISVDVLNQGLRPHLTLWHAKFRRWYNKEIKKDENSSPQEIQEKFPQYQSLSDEMLKVNQKLIEYRKVLEEIAMG